MRKILVTALAAMAVAIATIAGAPTAVASPSLVSGSAIYMDRGTEGLARCTLGFVLPGKDGLAEGLTAGHCGKVGDAVTNEGGVVIGSYVDSIETNFGEDIARIRLRGDGLPANSSSTYVPFNGKWLPILGVMSPAELNETRPILCKVGITTGQTCGPMLGEATEENFNFAAKSDHGDSGSAIFAFDGKGIYAAGVLLGTPVGSDQTVIGTPVVDFAKQWGVSVESPGR